MIKAYSLQANVLIHLADKPINYRLERREGQKDAPWLVLTESGFILDENNTAEAKAVNNIFLDEIPLDGICQYRARDISNAKASYDYTGWLRRGITEPIGYTFNNYIPPQGSWGEVITADDLRYTFLWGVDFRASNGASFTDDQIRFFIDDALKAIERQLCITVKKTRIMCEPDKRGKKKGADYDEDEPYYTFRRERIQRNGMITTRKRPIISVSRCDLMNRDNTILPLLPTSVIDRTKGKITFFNHPVRQSDTGRAVEAAINPSGPDAANRNLFYAIDYVAGFESALDVPVDLRQIIAKIAAISLLNNIGRGLMSGFSSSSLSMDGVSESFSSTQSATSAFYGADIKEYKDDIDRYIAENKMKFGHIVMGAL
jgi:hypothetical protein